jgi:hypothetical protein
MRYVRALCLVTCTALAVIAFSGIGSASASTMCMVEGVGKKCPAGKGYPAREYKAVLEAGTKVELELLPGPTLLECTSSTILMKTKEESGSPINGEMKTLSLGGGHCTEFCESATMLNLPYAAKISHIAVDGNRDGELVLTKGGVNNPPIIKLTKCGVAQVTCEYTAVSGLFGYKIVGGTPAVLIADHNPFNYSAGSGEMACGMSLQYTARYKMTEPSGGLFVTEKP